MEPRKRGRPLGSSRHNADDALLLARTADIIVADNGVKPTTALRRLGINQQDDAKTRRLQRKWKRQAPALLAAAHQRKSAARMRATETIPTPWPASISPAAQAMARLREQLASAGEAFQRMQQQNQRWIEQIQKIQTHKPWLDSISSTANALKRLEEQAAPAREALKRLQQQQGLSETAQRMAKLAQGFKPPTFPGLSAEMQRAVDLQRQLDDSARWHALGQFPALKI